MRKSVKRSPFRLGVNEQQLLLELLKGELPFCREIIRDPGESAKEKDAYRSKRADIRKLISRLQRLKIA